MNKWLRMLVAVLLGATLPTGAFAADAATPLDGYLSGLKTWSATFTQTVVDAKGKSTPGGSGRLTIVRPGTFRWESTPPGVSEPSQLLVADGRNLWFLDRDLDQCTVKPQDQQLAQSPAMLLAGGDDLRVAFTVQANGRRDGLEWVRAQPKAATSDFREFLFGFKSAELARLVTVDKLGQRVTLDFRDVKRNAPVPPAVMEFQRSQCGDLIGKPVGP